VIKRIAIGTVVALLAVIGLVRILEGPEDRVLTATFARTTSLYEGAKVKVLGVDVGSVESIEVKGTAVEVRIRYDADVKLPADVHALVVPPSIVGDRFVQLAPAYESGAVLADGATLDLDHTGVPLELDDTFDGIDKLAVGLGPKGANRDGAVSRLVRATANNLRGNGRRLNQTIREMAGAMSTLADSGDDVASTVHNLGTVTNTLVGSDADIRALVSNLVAVSTTLNGQRGDIVNAVRQLRTALREVGDFTEDNRGELKQTVDGLTTVTAVLARRTDELGRLADIAPVGLTDLLNIYVPRNWDPSRPWLTPPSGRTGSAALRGALLQDLDSQLAFTMGAVCASLPAEQRAQLDSFCTALEGAGGSIGALITELTGGGNTGLPLDLSSLLGVAQ